MADLSDQPYETIDTSRRYVLGEVSEGDWEGYGIWDRLVGNRLVERFPPTEEGIDLALQRFSELKWKDRRERWKLARVAQIATVAGAVLWVVAGTLATILFAFGIGPGSFVYVLDAFGYRLAVGSLLVLGVLVLVRWMQPGETPSPSLVGSAQREGPVRGFDLVLWVGVVAGVAVWTVSSIATEAVFRLEFDPLGQPPSTSAVVAQLVSTMSFRSWVASFVLLILRRLRLPGPPIHILAREWTLIPFRFSGAVKGGARSRTRPPTTTIPWTGSCRRPRSTGRLLPGPRTFPTSG